MNLLRLFILLQATLLAQWTVAEAEPSKATGSSDGARLFSRHCAQCHGPEGKGKIGPSLQAANDPTMVMQMIRTGKGMMPGFAGRLSPEQLKAPADFVSRKIAVTSLTGGDLSRGGVLYRINCSPCHRTAARGGALLYTPENAPSLTGLDAAAIAGAIRTGPGPMPAFPPSVFDNKDVASIVRYVQFLQQPSHPGGAPLRYYGPVAEGLVAFAAVVFLVLVGRWIEARGGG